MKKILAAVGAMAIVVGGGIVAFSGGNTTPKLETYEDTGVTMEIQEDEVPLARSFFVDLDDQISIDEEEVPLAICYVADWFSGGNEPSGPSSAAPEFPSYTDPVIESTIIGDDTPL